MHYKNGREANNGDIVVMINAYGVPRVGVLFGAVAGNDHCNGKIATISEYSPTADLANCLHIDDARALFEGPSE